MLAFEWHISVGSPIRSQRVLGSAFLSILSRIHRTVHGRGVARSSLCRSRHRVDSSIDDVAFTVPHHSIITSWSWLVPCRASVLGSPRVEDKPRVMAPASIVALRRLARSNRDSPLPLSLFYLVLIMHTWLDFLVPLPKQIYIHCDRPSFQLFLHMTNP